MRPRTKKYLKMLLILAIVLLVGAIAYVAYIYFSYSRIEDNQSLETSTVGSYSYFQDDEALHSGRAYNILTYNIGYGSNDKDFSFFMDGGKSSLAASDENVMSNICEIANVINLSGVDFIMLQEVDLYGTRSYHVNELELLNQFLKGYYYNSAVCYDTKYLLYPIFEPYGANKSAQVTYSSHPITQAVRKSLPVSQGLEKMFDYDRCYIKSRIPTANEKDLLLYNVHLSAYTDDVELKKSQIKTLLSDMEEEYKKGNYVICGGDFNQNIKDDIELGNTPSWAGLFPKELLPEGFFFAHEKATAQSIEHNSCRNLDEPYNEDTTFTVTVDGFIVSKNIKVHYYNNTNWGYRFSDHDPVLMQFFLR